jgi:peroxiredoxin
MTTDPTTTDHPPDRTPTPDRWRRRLVGPFSLLQVVGVLAAMVVVAVALVALNAPITPAPEPTPPAPGSGFVPVGEPVEGLRVGDRAPELTGTVNGEVVELKDLDGNVIRLADLRGRPVWINFWATWCPPCQEETPVLRDLYETHADDGLALIAISVQETTVEDVRAYVDRYDLGYTVGFDATSAVFHTYRAFGLPTQLFLDRDGVIRHVVLGPVTRNQAEQILAPLLAG